MAAFMDTPDALNYAASVNEAYRFNLDLNTYLFGGRDYGDDEPPARPPEPPVSTLLSLLLLNCNSFCFLICMPFTNLNLVLGQRPTLRTIERRLHDHLWRCKGFRIYLHRYTELKHLHSDSTPNESRRIG